jgi:hypothetical protein
MSKSRVLVILDEDPFKDHRLVGSRVAALFRDGRLVIDNLRLQVIPANAI